MTLKLVVRSEAHSGPEELLLSESSYGIGRLHDNDLSIQNDCVSGYHAELKRTPDGGYTVTDLKSTNGTFLNETRVTSPEEVKAGDRLKLGNLLITIEEHIEVVAQPETESFPGGGLSKVVSLKDDFGFASGENFNTYPIAPVKTPPAIGNGSVVPGPPVRMEEPAQESAMAAQQAERARQIEQAREAERARQIEQAREAERARQIEQAREAERARQIEQAREAERARQIEQAREAERARQIEQAREAERARQIEQARAAERAEVDLREEQDPASREDFGSKILGLTAQLESAMREISRLKAFLVRDSPGPVELDSPGSGPMNPGQSTESGREVLESRRSEAIDGKVMPEGQAHELRVGDRLEVRAGGRTPPPLPGQSTGNEVAMGVFRKPPILSTDQLRQQLEAARSAGKRSAENEARPCQVNGRPVG